MSLNQWTAELVKMQHAYGAPIDDQDIITAHGFSGKKCVILPYHTATRTGLGGKMLPYAFPNTRHASLGDTIREIRHGLIEMQMIEEFEARRARPSRALARRPSRVSLCRITGMQSC